MVTGGRTRQMGTKVQILRHGFLYSGTKTGDSNNLSGYRSGLHIEHFSDRFAKRGEWLNEEYTLF